MVSKQQLFTVPQTWQAQLLVSKQRALVRLSTILSQWEYQITNLQQE